MKIIIDDKRQTYRLPVPVLLGYHLLSDEEFKEINQSLQESHSLFNKNVHITNLIEEIRNDIIIIKELSNKNTVPCKKIVVKLNTLLSFVPSHCDKYSFANKHHENVDLSLGGIAFYSKKQLTTNDYLLLELTLLPSNLEIHVICRTISISPYNKGRDIYLIHGQFESFNENDQQILENYLEDMLEKQKKEKKST